MSQQMIVSASCALGTCMLIICYCPAWVWSRFNRNIRDALAWAEGEGCWTCFWTVSIPTLNIRLLVLRLLCAAIR